MSLPCPAAITRSDILRAVSSQQSCSEDSVRSLRELLDLVPTSKLSGKTGSRSTSQTTQARQIGASKRAPAKPKWPKEPVKIQEDRSQLLSRPEQAKLATNVVNEALNTLVRAVRESGSESGTTKRQVRQVGVPPESKRSTGQNNSKSGRTLKERSANQQSPSGKSNVKSAQEPAQTRPPSVNGISNIGECCHAAFSHLRRITPPGKDLQLENGMLAFVGKLLALKLVGLAAKELHALSVRLRGAAIDASTVDAQNDYRRLLTIADPGSEVDRLVISIGHQLAALRLIGIKREPQAIAFVLSSIKGDSATSPVRLILLLLQVTGDTARAGLQLQDLASTMLSCCADLSRENDDAASNRSTFATPAQCFELQTYALLARISMMRTTGCTASFEDLILKPFSKCLAAYTRRSQNGAAETYSLANELTQAFISELDSRSKNGHSSFAESTGLLAVHESLSSLAHAAGLPSEALRWFDPTCGGSNQLGDQSSVDAMAATARSIKRAAIALDALLLDGSIEDATSCLREAANALKQKMSCVIADERFAGPAILFFKAVSTYSRTVTSAARRNAALGSGSIRQLAERIASSCLALCEKALQARLHHRPETQDSKTGAVLQFLWRAASCGIEYAVCRALRTRPGELDSLALSSMLEDMEYCSKLALLTDDQLRTNDEDTNAPSASLVSISNAWLALYLAAKDTSQGTVIHSLEQSCHILEMGRKADQSRGYLPSKLNRLGRTLKSVERWHDAADCFKKALHVCLGIGVLKKVLAQYDPENGEADVWKSSDCKSIDEALESLLELDARYGMQKLEEGGFFDSETLVITERRSLLNRQLSILTSWSSSKTLWAHASRVIPTISMGLLEMYDGPTKALAHGSILLRLFSLALEKQSDFNHEFLDALMRYTISTIASLHGSKSERPQYRASYMRSLLQACLVLRDHMSTSSLVEEIIATWHGLMDSVDSGGATLESFTDIEEWSRLAQRMVDHLYMLGSGINRLGVLRCVMRLDAIASSKKVYQTSSTNLEFSVELLRLGYSEAAGIQLEHIRKQSGTLVSSQCRSKLLLVYAEYYLILGGLDQCYAKLREFEALRREAAEEEAVPLSTNFRLQHICETSDYHHISSLLARAHHCHEEAEHHARLQCSVLRAVWQTMESQKNARQSNLERSHSHPAAERSSSPLCGLAFSSTSAGDRRVEQSSAIVVSTCMQHILPRLTRAYDLAAELSASCGQYHDTVYSIEQSRRLTHNLLLPILQSGTLARKGDCLIRGGELNAGHDHLTRAFEMCQSFEQDHRLIAHHQAYGHYHHLCQQWQPELQVYRKASILLDSIEKCEFSLKHSTSLSPAEDQPTRAEIKAFVAGQAQKTSRKPRQRALAPPKLGVSNESTESQLPTKEPQSSTPSTLLRSLRAYLISLEAQSLLAQQDPTGCKRLLQDVRDADLSATTTDRLAVAWSRMSFMEALDAMVTDAVFSMLPESSMSIPASLRSDHDNFTVTFATLCLNSPKKKGVRTPKKATTGSSPSSTEVVQCLYRAVKGMLVRQESISLSLPLAELIEACSILASASMMLSYVNPDLARSLMDPARVALWLALPSNVAAKRDRSSVLGERLAKWDNANLFRTSITKLPQPLLKEDLEKGADFIDLIPWTWNVIAMSLDHNSEHLFLTQYRSDGQPLVVRLPLTRQNDGPDDEDSFAFSDAREELMNIIAGSDATVHSARDDPDQLKVKGARSQWWASREALDERLKDLLVNIENMWFGGFRSVFRRHMPANNLLARLQQSFEIILDKHLPSRQQSRQRAGVKKVKLDRHVLELFVGLGSHGEDNDLDESLTDLLYYVVDILQFNGELNAYDEIDFDSIIVEVQSALESYHEAFETSGQGGSISHTVLVLDKQLHAFPWESMPCLRDQSVSRVHSILDLQERLTSTSPPASPKGDALSRQISPRKGTYVLNPGCDLAQTQSRFEEPLSALKLGPSGWSSIIAREPSEQEFLSALYDSSILQEQQDSRILVYIGHGSGEQYVRHRKIKQLRYEHWMPSPSSEGSTSASTTEPPTMNPSVSVTLLFGCSSASLKLHSEFEPHGTPKSYMAAGAPALLGSLWDVTDGDVDRFAGSVLERWGLLERGICEIQEARLASKGKRKGKGAKLATAELERDEPDYGCMSLTEAVAKSRGECYLKYLNGAAMVVYGIPVSLNKTG